MLAWHTCVGLRYGPAVSSVSSFSWPGGPGTSRANAVGLAARGLLTPRSPSSRRRRHVNLHGGWRNINRLSIGYALGPRLRSRLTLGGLTFPRNPWAFGEQGFHLLDRYSSRHNLFRPVQPSSRSAFTRGGMLPYHAPGHPEAFAASVVDLSPVELSAQHRLTSELLRTL